ASYSCSELSGLSVGGRQFAEACSSMQYLRWDEPLQEGFGGDGNKTNIYTAKLPDIQPSSYVVYHAGCSDPSIPGNEKKHMTPVELELTPEKIRQKIEDPSFYREGLAVGRQITKIHVQFSTHSWMESVMAEASRLKPAGAEPASVGGPLMGVAADLAPRWMFAVWFST
ncbi:unnamed protein product, partial [Amoebophrya sp. A120]